LNLSKSDKLALFSLTAAFFARRDASNFFSISDAANFLATVLERAPRGNFGMTTGRRYKCESWMTCREAPSLGPSINADFSLIISTVAVSKRIEKIADTYDTQFPFLWSTDNDDGTSNLDKGFESHG